MTFFCKFKDVFGKPKQGIHRFRIPGTDTALVDYLLTLLFVWLISALTKTSLVLWTLILFSLSLFFHFLFCVPLK